MCLRFEKFVKFDLSMIENKDVVLLFLEMLMSVNIPRRNKLRMIVLNMNRNKIFLI